MKHLIEEVQYGTLFNGKCPVGLQDGGIDPYGGIRPFGCAHRVIGFGVDLEFDLGSVLAELFMLSMGVLCI